MTVYRTDYQPYPFEIPTVDLTFELEPSTTRVHSRLSVIRAAATPAHTPLRLDGEDIELVSLKIDGRQAKSDEFVLDDLSLTILNLPQSCEIDIECVIHPDKNTSLMGLYVSGQSLFTQCEAQGFRRITYFADRPDVMSIYRVTLRGDASRYPVLLANGNLVSQTELADGRHECCWQDPFPKPCYLFALVAGQFDLRQEVTTTRSGKPVTLQIYSDPGTYARTEWAMQSLVRALRWDESRFGLELDLDRFMIVAARDFNMGAMENKGLNIFNAAYVLADPQTATDANYQAIEAVIGHEYFHNWTGNRVTCRDWFELSLKEGLTVFRDQEFTADMLAEGLTATAAQSARAVKRIDDVATLRAAQFPEDAGPMAHPIRPESYEEISNFYTATVYEKGAEVIRMMHTLLGEETFQAGMREYFKRHDGQAVTCDDYVDALEAAWREVNPQHSLAIFKRWYGQAGTPRVNVSLTHTDGDKPSARLTLTQTCEPVGVEKTAGLVKAPFQIPLRIGALSPEGAARTLSVVGSDGEVTQSGQTVMLALTETQSQWQIEGLKPDDLLSLNRGFSAPVAIDYDYSDQALAKLAQYDSDAWARWEALQLLYSRYLLEQASTTPQPEPQAARVAQIVAVCDALLVDTELDPGYVTRLLSLPSDKYLLQQMTTMDPLSLAKAKQALEIALAQALSTPLMACVNRHVASTTFDTSANAAGKRALRNLALALLCQAGHNEAKAQARAQYEAATNMTDRLGALRALLMCPVADDEVAAALADFYKRFEDDPLVIDKWFALQATAPGTTVQTIQTLLEHPAFVYRNPNRLRALVFQFCMNNPLGFHAADGAGYEFWREHVVRIDQANPEVAARLARTLDHWRLHVEPLRSRMQVALEAVNSEPKLSGNTREIVGKALTL